MRALLQRVREAQVAVDGDVIGHTDAGLLIFVCAMRDDNEDVVMPFASKIAKLRIFQDEAGKMNRSLVDVRGGALVVSQFTLAADTQRGNRPGFSSACAPEKGKMLYLAFADALSSQGISVSKGRFGADMQVTLTNDGPVTIWLDTDAK